ERDHPVDIAAQRLFGGPKGADHAAVMDGHGRSRFSFGRICKQGEELMGAIEDVDMRIFLIGDERSGVAQHGIRYVAVKVELGSDRCALAYDRANPLEEVTLAIVIALGSHRAMQRQY